MRRKVSSSSTPVISSIASLQSISSSPSHGRRKALNAPLANMKSKYTSEDRPLDLLMAHRSQLRLLLHARQLPTAAARPSIVIAICFSSPSTSMGLYIFLAIKYILGTLYIRPMASHISYISISISSLSSYPFSLYIHAILLVVALLFSSPCFIFLLSSDFNILQQPFSYHFLVVSLFSVYRYLPPIYTSSYPCILHTHLPSSLPFCFV
ncbi:hypothetical protein BDZ97DRAFT_1785958 [Flammula alnicola]|nr:hypothetical protein BDZ97DRAFT_1785958 [Flammula alnicola]